ncbi:MAG: MFS transporter [Peptococcaceae bacterium]|nr:MFS transporter [Peptococcaceae bacterium]
MAREDDTAPEKRPWLTAGVAAVGLTSFFADSGHEIATSVLPAFLTSVLHASAGALGLIEGVSDALTGIMKMVGGPLANDEQRRGRLASSGYLGTALATGAIGLAATVWQAGALRAFAWLSRGLRSPARDTMLASLAPPHAYGRTFGLERAGDNLGAVAGPLLAAALVARVGIRPAIYFSVIPGLFATVSIWIAAREIKRHALPVRKFIRLEFARLKAAGLLPPLLPVACFELGNTATTLLILRATQLLHTGSRSFTAAASLAIIIYAAHNAMASLVALLGGRWIDKAGPGIVFATGTLVYIPAYIGFALKPATWPPLLGAFLLAGAGIGLAETSESALVARMLPDHLRGTVFGLLGGVQSFGDFAATAAVGLLYSAVSPAAGFSYAAAWMALATVTSFALRLRKRAPDA